MIEFPRDQQNIIPTSSLKIIGLGGAGANMLDRIALDGIEGAELVAMNTDVRTLAGAVASEKITLGRNLTKGLGAGGDPELGQQAVIEAEKEIRATLKGRRIIFLCVGLGGGTGSGGSPIITRIAREEGAFVVVFATMPFVFEGKRRREQAETALNELAVLSNALVTFDNNRMGELVLAKQGIHEAFVTADRMISESIKAVIRLVVPPGLIHVGLDELMSALRTTRSRCLFGSGIASGKDRASRAMRGALSSPLLDQGSLLKDAQTVLVHLCGGEDLTLYEVELLMQGLLKYVPEKAHILFGAAVDPSMGADLSITLISALPEDCLASAPRESLTRIAAYEPALDPSIGFERAKLQTSPTLPAKRSQEAAISPSGIEPAPSRKADAISPSPISAPPSFDAAAPMSLPPSVTETKTVAIKQSDAPVTKDKTVHKPEPPTLFQTPFAETEQEPEGMPGKIEPVAEEAAKPAEIAVKPDFLEVIPSYEEEYTHPEGPGFADPLESEDFMDEPWPEPNYVFPPVEEEIVQALPSAAEVPAIPRGKAKISPAQTELSFDGGPRGRFSGETPNFFEGEDLDIPPFLRKKKP